MDLTAYSLSGQTALITGGGTGLGFGIASCCVNAGAQVILVGRRPDVLAGAAGQLGRSAHYRVHDITHFDRNRELIGNIESEIGPIDILVNNAGNYLKKKAVETTETEFRSVLETHLTAAFSLTRFTTERMVERRRGSVLYIGSMASFLGVPNVLAYTAAKSACLGIVRGLAAELSWANVRVNAIAPGWIMTPMTESAFASDPARRDRVLARTPMGRFGDPDDVGHAAVYLSSHAAKFVTGTVLTIDGGASIGF